MASTVVTVASTNTNADAATTAATEIAATTMAIAACIADATAPGQKHVGVRYPLGGICQVAQPSLSHSFDGFASYQV